MGDKSQKNKEKGFILLYRSAFDNLELQDDGVPFDLFHAWFDLVASANHEEKEIKVRGESLLIQRGQRFTSIRKLAVRWDWSTRRVRGTLNQWEKAGMISVSGTHNGTLVTVINYDVYNDSRHTKRKTKVTTDETTGWRAESTQTNNELNNYSFNNNDKKKKTAPLINAWGEVVEE